MVLNNRCNLTANKNKCQLFFYVDNVKIWTMTYSPIYKRHTRNQKIFSFSWLCAIVAKLPRHGDAVSKLNSWQPLLFPSQVPPSLAPKSSPPSHKSSFLTHFLTILSQNAAILSGCPTILSPCTAKESHSGTEKWFFASKEWPFGAMEP